MRLRKKNVRGAGKFNPVTTRRVRKFGGALYINLPGPFAEERRIRVGDVVVLIMGKDLRITKAEEDGS
jgi:hypothetical protein